MYVYVLSIDALCSRGIQAHFGQYAQSGNVLLKVIMEQLSEESCTDTRLNLFLKLLYELRARCGKIPL